jgi:peptidoglycan hydrolase-like protein with peptidoglycan-binding domain
VSVSAPGAPPNLPPPPGYRPPQQQAQRPPPPPGGGAYNPQLHPRGRGGLWIATKGDGYGAGGPNQTTQQLQQRLQQLGFQVPADGKFGPQTEAAVKAFQARYGLDSSGGVDAATMALLQNPPPQTLAQVQAQTKAAKATSTSARKTATAKAKAKAGARTTRVRASARTGGAQRSAALRAGVPAGTSTSVSGVGHMGTGMLTQGTGMTGSSNSAVSNLQAALNQAGFKLSQDGRFGPRTEAAVKQLQTKYGLTADGIVGPATKALLLGLSSGTSRTASRTAARVSRATTAITKRVKGQPAVLRTTGPRQKRRRPGSSAGGKRMKLKGPAPKAPTLKYSASGLPDPDLEETTLAFGFGGQPSRSIKDARDNEPTPLVDQPVWDRTQEIADPPDYAISDGRDIPPPSVDTTLDDGRAYDQVQVALNEAIAVRKAAKDGRTFARALARERLLRARLQEAGPFDEAKHPRTRGGKWAEVLGKLKALPVNKPGEIHGVTAMRLSTGHYAAGIPGNFVHHESPEHVATAITGHLDQQAELHRHGERAVAGLSPEAAQHFTRDWSQRGDPGGAPERHEMYSQVYSEDPKGFARDVFSQPMKPEHRAEAEVALADAKTHAQRNRVAPYFDLTKPHEMVHVDSLRPTKIDPESSYQNASKRMAQAARGELDKRKPLTGQVGGDGRLLLVDGNATLEAAKRQGITHVPVEIRPRASNLNPKTKPADIHEQYRLDRAAIAVEKEQRRARSK